MPSTQIEAQAVDATFEQAGIKDRRVLLLDADASLPRLCAEIQRLHPRILHLATHGLMGTREHPLDAALALAAPAEPASEDTGFLTLEDLLRSWAGRLTETDLVVLSACQSGVGTRRGDAEFSLPWGFFFSGATAVVASLWQVDDASTALLMARFHQNRLGQFEEPRSVRGREYRPHLPLLTLDALEEAKAWLRSLTRDQAQHELAGLEAILKNQRGGPLERADLPANNDPHPFDHPYYWAPFVLLGCPD